MKHPTIYLFSLKSKIKLLEKFLVFHLLYFRRQIAAVAVVVVAAVVEIVVDETVLV